MTDERLEQMVGSLLRAGVLLSAVIVFGGGVWWLAEMGRTIPAYGHFDAGAPESRHIGGWVASLAHPRPETVIELGLLLLIATPVARVALALVGFALEHDRAYVVITVIVLVVLIYSLVMPFGA